MFPQVNGWICPTLKSCCCFDCGDVFVQVNIMYCMSTNEDLNIKTPAAQPKPPPNATINQDDGNNKLCRNDQI